MKPHYRYVIIFSLICFCIVAWNPWKNVLSRPPEARTDRNPGNLTGKTSQEGASIPDPEEPVSNRTDPSSRATLARFKEKYVILGKGEVRMAERVALAEEIANSPMMFTADGLELWKFLQENELSNGGLSELVSRRFYSSNGAEARKLFLEMPDSLLRQQVSQAAGASCPEAEFEAYHAKLLSKSKPAAARVLYGRNLRLAKTDPYTALASAVEQLQEPDPAVRQSYLSMITSPLAPEAGVDFERLERLLPERDTSTGRSDLFRQWGLKDAAEAAEYVMDHPERISPTVMEQIANSILSRYGYQKSLDWVQQFPGGPYFDNAAVGVIGPLMDMHPDQARELAAQISHPKIRAKQFATITSIEKIRKAERESGVDQ